MDIKTCFEGLLFIIPIVNTRFPQTSVSYPGYCQCVEGSGAGGKGLRGVAADWDPPPGETRSPGWEVQAEVLYARVLDRRWGRRKAQQDYSAWGLKSAGYFMFVYRDLKKVTEWSSNPVLILHPQIKNKKKHHRITIKNDQIMINGIIKL